MAKGQILNHSSKTLLVIENDGGPAIAHLLGPKRKTPSNIDADGFKRADGERILLHKDWWKIFSFSTADIWEFGDNLLVPVSLAFPVSDGKFGSYKLDESKEWGEELSYVTAVIKNERGEVISYVADKYGELSKAEAIGLAHAGKLDNVVVVENSRGNIFLRTKRNTTVADNLLG